MNDTKLAAEAIKQMNSTAMKRVSVVIALVKEAKNLPPESGADIIVEAFAGLRHAIFVECLEYVAGGISDTIEKAPHPPEVHRVLKLMEATYWELQLAYLQKFEASAARFHNLIDGFKTELKGKAS